MKRVIYILVETRNDTDETGRWCYNSQEFAAATGRNLAGAVHAGNVKNRTEQMDRVFAELLLNGRSRLGQYDWIIEKAEVD